MAATVSSERRESPGGNHSFSSIFAMDRDNQRRSRSTRHHQASSGNGLSSPKRSEDVERSSVMSPNSTHQHGPKSTAIQDGAGDDRSGMQDWKYPRSSASTMKRRNSQRSPSPSRPRSQQGSQVDQVKEIDHTIEMERADASGSRKAARHSTKQTHRKSLSEDLIRNVIEEEEGDSPPAASRYGVDEGERMDVARNMDRQQISTQLPHERSYSGDAGQAGRPLHSGSRDDANNANYTWQAAQDRDVRPYREADYKDESIISRTPLLNASYKAMAAPLAPRTSVPVIPPSSTTTGHRNYSPSPRLPNFVNANAQQQEVQQGRPSSPRHLSSASAYTNAPYPSPRPGVRSLNHPLQSPTPSQSSQSQGTLPGQSFMPPSLMAAQGSGGGVQGNVAASKQQPSFVSKLYAMLEDESIREMISWGPSGTVFSVANPAEFSKIVLPNWFKHSNWQSFVRQLNMYGFHKVNHTYQGTPEDEIQVWEFKHPSFRRGEVHLLNDIKRKSSRHKRQGSYGRSMGGMGDYDIMTGGGGRSPGSITPSPEMGMQYLSSSGVAMRDTAAMPGPSRHHPRHQTSHSIGGALDYPGGCPGVSSSSRGIPPSASSSAVYAMGSGEMSTSRSEQLHHVPSASHQYQPGHYPPSQHRRGQHGGSMGMMHSGANDASVARMDDLSDRIDAIIRHASYMENQLRSVSDQLYQSQQNEISMGRHINHLESQLRGIEDHLHAQGGVHRRPPPPSSPSTLQSNMPPVPSRDLTRGQMTSNYPPNSPIVNAPGYSSSYQRGVTHSSADAYQKLPPPPSSSVAGGPAGDGRGRN